jgi:uncharacterized protein YcnI
MIRKRRWAPVVATACAVAAPTSASGHATVSPVQPQGKALTAARTSYVLRVPNERDNAGTRRVVLFVPAAVQEAITFKKVPGWKVRLYRDGARTTRVAWTARSAGSVIAPGFYEEFPFRFQNPATAQRLCFGAKQAYERARGQRKGETVYWTGPADSETPASCVDVVDS